MCHILSFPRLGSLQLHDVYNTVDIRILRHDFVRVDKHRISKYKYQSRETFTKVVDKTITYPEYCSLDDEQMRNAIQAFADIADVPYGSNITVHAHKSCCFDDIQQTNDWFIDEPTTKGILCVQKFNTIGGIYEFRAIDDKDYVIPLGISPGQMMTYSGGKVEERQRWIHSKDNIRDGCHNMLIFTYET